MAFRKPILESALVSAGELTLGELGSVVCDRDESPRVNMLKLGRAGAAIVTDLVAVKRDIGRLLKEETKTWRGRRSGRAHETIIDGRDLWAGGVVDQKGSSRLVTLLGKGRE